MKPKIIIRMGLMLILLFGVVMAQITFFPDSSTIEQQFNSLCAGLISASIGAMLLVYGDKKSTLKVSTL